MAPFFSLHPPQNRLLTGAGMPLALCASYTVPWQEDQLAVPRALTRGAQKRFSEFWQVTPSVAKNSEPRSIRFAIWSW